MKPDELLVMFGAAFFAVVLSLPVMAQGNKIDICHIPPDDPDNAHTISVSERAVDKHIDNHGDFEGECECEADEDCPVGSACTAGECEEPCLVEVGTTSWTTSDPFETCTCGQQVLLYKPEWLDECRTAGGNVTSIDPIGFCLCQLIVAP